MGTIAWQWNLGIEKKGDGNRQEILSCGGGGGEQEDTREKYDGCTQK